MIRRLRVTFIVVSLASMAAVLLVILGVVNWMNYRQVVNDADRVLDILAENNGTFPERGDPGESVGRKRRMAPPGMSPETPYESRYFTVCFGEDGTVLRTDMGRIAAVDETEAEEYARRIRQMDAARGFLNQYRYVKQDTDDGQLIIFLDCGRSLAHVRSFLGVSAAVAVTGMAAVLLLLVLLSKKAVKPYVESYEKQKRFITDAGHEIRTPLTIIDADAELIALETGENEWVEDIKKQIFRLRDLTEDLIFLSKMEENNRKAERMEFPISEVAAETAQSFQALAKLQGKTFESSIEPLLSYTGEMKSIQRLFSILLDNALKYSPEGGKITFRLEKRGRNLWVTVSNTAEPMSKEQISHLFDRFYRVDASRNSGTGGHGIGLSIARAIVNAHKGKISALLPDGKSLTIQVIL